LRANQHDLVSSPKLAHPRFLKADPRARGQRCLWQSFSMSGGAKPTQRNATQREHSCRGVLLQLE